MGRRPAHPGVRAAVPADGPRPAYAAGVDDDTFERERELALLDRVAADLAEVDRALERLSEGSYGRCEACGGPIGEARLAVVPAARTCADHGLATGA